MGLVACNSAEPAEETQEETQNTEMEKVDEGHNHDQNAAYHEAGDDALYVPEGAYVFFANLENGQTVTSPFTIEFGIEGMEVRPAGEIVKGTGHHHLLIGEGYTEPGVIVPADETHIHYGDGSTSAEMTLEPGEYMLTMQFANGAHQSYGQVMSATVNIIVE